MRMGSASQPAVQFNHGAAVASQFRHGKLASAWYSWINELAPWTHAVTVTFQRFLNGDVISEAILVAALRHFLRVTDVSIYGRRGADRGLVIPSVVVMGWGTYRDHPHAHLALQAPPGMLFYGFTRILNAAADKTVWLAAQREIKPYRDAGWATYLVDHDPDNLVIPLLRDGRNTSSAAASTT